MKKAVFIDRDGTLNIDNGYTYKVENCKLIEAGIGKILKKLKKMGYLLVIITNQAGIDKGYYTEKDFYKFMDELERKLNVKFDGIYFCPYHQDYTGLRKCRKPDNGMLLKAKKDLNIDLEKSFMIGDSFKDIEAGNKSKCITILINNQNLNLNNIIIKPKYIVKKWSEIEKIIIT